MSLASVYIPALERCNDWGALSKSPQGKATKEEFMKYAEGFVGYLNCKLSPSIDLCFYTECL